MATRSLIALDYANYQTNNILKKHAKNRPLGDIEHRHSYVPPQPVLSCRTVDIDLPGTRTYRPKSTLDILDEQQRLIRNLYNKQRSAASAPPRQRSEPAPRSSSEHSIRRVNIEVKGRPLTSVSHGPYQNEPKPSVTTKRRPKTTGRLKHIQPATDCFMVIKVDKDLLQTSLNNRELTNRIHSHWKSENNNLAVGKFVRGQKRPDDVPPTLDAWLTFGGAAGDSSEGVIDAFASFKNSEEYYNIEGSVGSRVAQQLQKGDKIRIGINGVLQSQDLKIKKWKKETTQVEKEPEEETQTPEEIKEEDIGQETQEKTSQEIVEEEEVEPEPAVDADADVTDAKIADDNINIDDDFKELVLQTDAFDDLLEEDTMEVEKPKEAAKEVPAAHSPAPAPAVETSNAEEPEAPIVPRLTIPLSWDDQCTKSDVKVIHARVSPRELIRPVMSETFPVKFEKLINGGSRPKLAQPRADGFKIKQRAVQKPGSASKVKVVYIDPLSREEEEKVNGMSVDEIVNYKFEGRSRENTSSSLRRNFKERDDNIMAINEDNDMSFRPKRISSTKSGPRHSRPTSNYSLHSDHGGIPSPKLKTAPIHSSANHTSGDLTIMSRGARYSTPTNENQRASRAQLKIAPVKPLHRSGAGQGSSIKSGPPQGETEYIKITSQLKIPPGGAPPSSPSQPVTFSPFHYSPGVNSPRGWEHQDVSENPNYEEETTKSQTGESIRNNSNKLPSREATPSLKKDNSITNDNDDDKIDDDLNDTKGSILSSESPAPTTVAISIPTADEMSDKESPDHSPARYMGARDDLTPMQRRERDMTNEQIDQITDLLGSAIVDS